MKDKRVGDPTFTSLVIQETKVGLSRKSKLVTQSNVTVLDGLTPLLVLLALLVILISTPPEASMVTNENLIYKRNSRTGAPPFWD